MQKLIFLAFLMIQFQAWAGPGDTIKVKAHDHVDMTWYGAYDQMAYFPTGGKSFHKANLTFTMGCASGGCSDWDYDVEIYAMMPTGTYDSNIASIDTISTMPLDIDTTWNVYEILERFELARAVTPYGTYMADGTNGFDNSWEHRFHYEVTDFIPLLKDSVLIRAFYSGWSSGFDVTLDFDFIEGTPVREVLGIQNMYSGGKGYTTHANFESTFFYPKKFWVDASTKNLKSRITISGHGFDNNVNCAEFCPRKYFLNVNSSMVGSNSIWNDDCGHNPIYPQGGTWVYNRAGWCPGGKVKIFEHDLSNDFTAGDSLAVDMDMESYTWTGSQTPSYKTEVQLVHYGEPNFEQDVEMLKIIAPSLHENHLRKNPICAEPVVKIRNTGSAPLSTALIEYGVVGGTPCYYRWWASHDTAILELMEAKTIKLPVFNWNGFDNSNPQFYAKVSEPNLKPDEYALNNELMSAFETVDEQINQLILWVKTNSAGHETGYSLVDDNDSVWFKKDPGSLTASTTYLDTLLLNPGCYTFRVEDTDGDGLSWWANSDGSGFARIRRITGSIAKSFGSDFGSEIHYQFTVSYSHGSDPEPEVDCSPRTGQEDIMGASGLKMGIYPNPSDGLVEILLEGEGQRETEVKVFDGMGMLVYVGRLNFYGSVLHPLDLSGLPSGWYVVEVRSGEDVSRSKLILSQ